jgi:hypothetical protein
MSLNKRMMILIAGPYRSGTGDDPSKMEANLRHLEAYSLPLYRAGHLPVIGEWISLPIIRSAGSQAVGDPIYREFLYPAASRLLERCDAVLRVGGESQGADEDVRIAKERGLPIYYSLADVPGFASETAEVETTNRSA